MKATTVYFRFTNDIYSDIDRGYSIDFRTKEHLSGLCAWSTGLDTQYDDKKDIIEYVKNKAAQIIKNSYAGYSENPSLCILVGDYAGNSNDGVCIKNVDVLEIIEL